MELSLTDVDSEVSHVHFSVKAANPTELMISSSPQIVVPMISSGLKFALMQLAEGWY